MITFCIATAKNERAYIELLIKSLQNSVDLTQCEILVFIDSDNENTYDMLRANPNIKLYKNDSEYPIGGQRNISVMFNAAKNDIVCYLQSDMVVGKDLDKYILETISEDVVLSLTRIEPPLHPESPEKITMDFGITPQTFKYEEFNEFVKNVQDRNLADTESYFAPFAVYKKTWFNVLGGFDTQFKCSREDSDILLRMKLSGLKVVQTWKGIVYHFTCVSSRGKDWYVDPNSYDNDLRQQADIQELKRFIRKWGFFGHDYQPKYDVALKIDVDRYVDFELLKWLEPFFNVIILNDDAVSQELIRRLYFESYYYSNLKCKYSLEHWKKVEWLFNPTYFENRVVQDEGDHDIVVSCKYSELLTGLTNEVKEVITTIHSVISINEIGVFGCGPLTINIKRKNTIEPPKKVLIPDGFLDKKFIFK